MEDEIINNFEESSNQQQSGLVTIAHTNFFCNNFANGSLVAGYFFSKNNLQAGSNLISASVNYAEGDTTHYTLLYQIDNGSRQNFTFTPTNRFFTKSLRFDTVFFWLIVPYQKGNPRTRGAFSVRKS
jgi:hypothetical protein